VWQGRSHCSRINLVALLAAFLVLVVAAAALAKPGASDRSFSGDGRATVDFGDPNGASAEAVAIGSRGRITAAGDIGGGSDFAVARLLPGGAPDRSFSGDGQISGTLGLNGGTAADVALTRNADTVIAGVGRRSSDTPYGFALAEFRRNGTLNPAFADQGVRVTLFRGLSEISQIAIDRRGRIVAVGYSAENANYRDASFAIARYTPNGRLDHSFSGDGKLILHVGSGNSQARAVQIDGAGRILVGGIASKGGKGRFALVRLTAGGRLDRSFGTRGEAFTPGIRRCSARCPVGISDLALDHRGRIIAAGDALIARYLPNGKIDRTFSSDGAATVRNFGASAVAVDHAGRIVLAGNSGDQLPIDFALMRLTSRGAVDERFGTGGMRIDHRFSSASDLAIDRRGRILAVGRAPGSSSQPGSRFAFGRYLSR
jgi:uncharacterized delta-60 repeat protein